MTDDNVNYLSQASLDGLKQERENLKSKIIPEIAKRIDEAKQQGDLSENAEYHQAREDMSWAQGRLLELGHIIENAKIISNKKTGTVSVGSSVKVKIKDRLREFKIVGQQESDPLNGKISNESPIGEALIGHEEGDKVEVNTPAGKQVYEIISIA